MQLNHFASEEKDLLSKGHKDSKHFPIWLNWLKQNIQKYGQSDIILCNLLFLMSARLSFSQAVHLLSAAYLSSFLPRLLLAGATSCRGAITLLRWLQGRGCAWGFSLWTIKVVGRTWGSDCIWGVEHNSQSCLVAPESYALLYCY